MATRKTEWLASIKPILDKDDIKNDAKALAKELSDILEVPVGADATNLEQLSKEFNQQLTKMGKQQIVFSEKTLQGIVSQFASAVAEGFSKGADIGIQESLKALQAERAQFVAQQKQLQAQKQKFKKIQEWTYDIEDMEDNEFHFFNSNEIDAMKKEAKKIGISFDDYVLKIKQEVEELQYSLGKMAKGKIPWDNDVIAKFYERSNDMFRMSRTLSKNPNIVQDKEILGDYDFSNLKDMFAEDLFAYAADFDRVVDGIYNSLNKVSIEIGKIDTKLQTIGERSGTIVNNQELKDGLKTLQEIEDAYERILTKDKNRPQRPDQKKLNDIQKALEWQPTGTKKDEGIKVIAQKYQSAKNTGDWVQEYEALLKYTRLYESYLKSENKAHRNKVTKPGNDFTKLYNQLKPMYENAQNALRNLVNKATNQPLVGIGGVGGEASGTTPEDVANADKIAEAEKLAREEAEKKEKTEIEALEVTKQRRVEEEKTSEAIEKQNKLLLYRRVEGDLDPNRISSRSADALYDKQNKPTIQNALESEFGGFGDGLYASPLSGAQDLIPLFDNGKVTFFEFDASGYNFYINKTVEQADILRGFLSSLQKFVGAGTILDASKLTKIEDLNEEELFKIAQRIFENFSMTKEQFHAWLEGAKQESERIANLFAKGQVPENRHNFGTRFMKELGYEGVLNVTGEEDYDGNYQGSVIYDPDITKIKESMLVFKSTAEYLEHLRVSAQNAEQSVSSLNNDIKETKEISQGSGNMTGIDDDSETIAKENGALEDKLELLRDIADQYAVNITQKQRDRYEELNQKDMDSGLSAKEEERYYELGEQIDAADSALEEFGQTYDKIILKLENGNKVEILPDDKGLRSLYKFADEYGETYGGVEIEDVIFERVKQEANAHQENTTAIKNETKAQEELNNVKGQSSGTGDASSADVDAAKAEAEKQRLEKERIEAEKIALQQENEAKLKAEADAKAKLQADLVTTNQQLTDVQKAKALADVNARKVEDESRVKDGIIQGLREQLADVKSIEGGAKASIGVEELKNVLNAITYNVKVVQDTDGADNKVAIDEASLEATLNKVFANILNPQTQQNDKINPEIINTLTSITSNDSKKRDVDINPHYLTDPQGKIVTAYRGISQTYGGLVSDRYHGGTFFTDDIELAKQYAGELGKIEQVYLSMKNPLEIFGEGSDWNDITYIGLGADEVSRKLYEIRDQIELVNGLLDNFPEDGATVSDKGLVYNKGLNLNFDSKEGLLNYLEKLIEKQEAIFEDPSNIYGNGDTNHFVELAKSLGYDGVIFRDVYDGLEKASNLMVTFEQDQIHYIDTIGSDAAYAIETLKANTDKIDPVNASNVDTIAGTALDSRLAEIKSVLDSIDNKIANGGTIITKKAIKTVNTEPKESQTSRNNAMRSIINDYETMGNLAARFANDGNLETKARLDNLKEEIKRKRESLNITMDENAKLREKYSIAFDAQKKLLDAAKAQKAIDDQRKSTEKDNEAAWKKQIKDAQRASGINAATSMANSGDQSVLRAIGTNGISADFEKQARELSNQIKALRALRDEISQKGEQATETNRDNLSKQISKVKELKTEVDDYLKIHEKYSGDNATDLGDASAFGAAGTDEYWNNITKAIQAQSQGRVVIKGLNADTGELTGTTKIAANTFAQWSATVDPITGRLSMLRTGIKKTETLIETITRKTKEIFTYFSGSSIVFKIFNELKRGIQYVKEIDLALTELKKVTDETEETYDKFLQTAAKTGARLGTTISSVTEATATFAKLGYSMEQAAEMAEAALVYKNVGDNIASAEDAADSIISTLKGFKLEASDSMLIVDKFNEVGNRFAITSQGIGEALRLSASALNEGKNSLDESIGLITAAM